MTATAPPARSPARAKPYSNSTTRLAQTKGATVTRTPPNRTMKSRYPTVETISADTFNIMQDSVALDGCVLAGGGSGRTVC